MDVKQWLLNKFIDWQIETNSRGSVRQWADHLGVGSVILNQLMNGTRERASIETIWQIGRKCRDYSICDIVNYPRPFSTEGVLPVEVQSLLESSVFEISKELESKGIAAGTPEAELIAKTILERHGWRMVSS